MVNGNGFLAKLKPPKRLSDSSCEGGLTGAASRQRKVQTALLLCCPLFLAALCYVTNPFCDEIARKTLSTSGLSVAQRSNIQLAAGAINGTVLQPGEEFSFNKIVGPRSESRGYRAAPSYLGPENPATVGGGVCLMSSELYQVALESGCGIEQRLPHLRTVRSVPPGLDATVWYGKADLKFKNTLAYPVQLTTSWTPATVTIAMLGRKPKDYHPASLERIVTRHTAKDVVVELIRRQNGKQDLISRDHYLISTHS